MSRRRQDETAWERVCPSGSAPLALLPIWGLVLYLPSLDGDPCPVCGNPLRVWPIYAVAAGGVVASAVACTACC